MGRIDVYVQLSGLTQYAFFKTILIIYRPVVWIHCLSVTLSVMLGYPPLGHYRGAYARMAGASSTASDLFALYIGIPTQWNQWAGCNFPPDHKVSEWVCVFASNINAALFTKHLSYIVVSN